MSFCSSVFPFNDLGPVICKLCLRWNYVFNLIRVIGQEYLGINGLFADILAALQLVELGIGPAIAYSLYKPLSSGDTEKVKSLMALFKKAYRFIGIFIIIAGLLIMPFLRLLYEWSTRRCI